MADRSSTRLGTLLSFANGRTSPLRAAELDYPVYGSNGIIGHCAHTNTGQQTIVIGRVGSYCGSLHWVEGPCWVTDNAIHATSIGDNDLRFLFYLLKTCNLNELREGSGQPLLNQTILRQIDVVVPLPSEQSQIATVLRAFDDKIELNRKMNQTLEAMAQALFKSWFVDFNGHDDLVDSDSGRIPRGWRFYGLHEMGTLLSGGTPKRSEPSFWNGEIPWISAKSMSGFLISESERRVTNLGAANGTKLVPAGTVLFVVRGMSLASEFRHGLTTREVTFNQDLKAIVDSGTVNPILILLFLSYSEGRILDLTDEASHGTRRLTSAMFRQLQLALPDREEQDRIARPLKLMIERMKVNDMQSRTLAETRDALLPKLISGEIRVPEAEEVAEAAL